MFNFHISRKLVVLAVIALLLVGAGVFLVWKYQNKNVSISNQIKHNNVDNTSIDPENETLIASLPRDEELEKKIQAVDTSDWKTYRNEEMGVEFQYSSDFEVVPLTSYDNRKYLGFYIAGSAILDSNKLAEINVYSPNQSQTGDMTLTQHMKTFITECSSLLEISSQTDRIIKCPEEFEIPFFIFTNPKSESYLVLNFNFYYYPYYDRYNRDSEPFDVNNPDEYFGIVKTLHLIR